MNESAACLLGALQNKGENDKILWRTQDCELESILTSQ